MVKLQLLKQYFGHDKFREGQEALVDCILDGHDCIGIMPTGAGKSICYQLPTMIMSGISIVISPLISLMKDQVGALNENGISAAYINSSLSETQIAKVILNAKEGRYKLIYVAPERLDLQNFISFASSANISMVTVDEGHCVSQWGQDFRPSYRKITLFIEKLPRRPIVSAFTATATDEVRQDIIKMLNLKNPLEIVTGFNRENLYFEVQEPADKYDALTEYLKKNSDKSGIVYCSTRDNVENVCTRLNSDKYNATRYHAGLSEDERNKNQDDFLFDNKTIMVATNAFGMGINKSNVSFVIHFNMPKNIESYYQEAGRAGRDGTAADCILFYGGKDVITNQYFIENTNEKNDLTSEIIEQIKQKDRERLKQMTYYCHTNDCLRDYILKYFKDKPLGFCGNCSNCLNSFEQMDITEYAQKILSCISRMNGRFGIKVLIDTLRGSKSAKILSFGLNELKTYGIIPELSEKKIREIINFLVINDYIFLTNSEFPTAKLTDNSKNILFNSEKIYMKIAKDDDKKQKVQTKIHNKLVAKSAGNIDMELFAQLKTLRKSIAEVQKVPANDFC